MCTIDLYPYIQAFIPTIITHSNTFRQVLHTDLTFRPDWNPSFLTFLSKVTFCPLQLTEDQLCS